MKPEYATILVKRRKDSRAKISFKNTLVLNEHYLTNIKNQIIDFALMQNMVIEIDLQGIRFIDNSIVDLFNLVSRVGRRRNSRIVLINVNRELIELLDLIKIYSVLDIREIIPETKMEAA
jgi:ABC-type transporter Mla MlaB component